MAQSRREPIDQGAVARLAATWGGRARLPEIVVTGAVRASAPVEPVSAPAHPAATSLRHVMRRVAARVARRRQAAGSIGNKPAVRVLDPVGPPRRSRYRAAGLRATRPRRCARRPRAAHPDGP